MRYLAKSDYGAFAWGLAVASMGASIAVLGLNRGVNRFVPVDHERGDYASMFGTMVLALAGVGGLGLALVALVLGARGMLTGMLTDDPVAIGLLLVLIGLAPTEALDSVFEGLVATFARPRVLCIRRFVIGPVLKLGAVLTVVAAQGSVLMLAWCYLLAGLIGVAIYVLVLWAALREAGLLQELRRARPVASARRVLGFSLPLLTTDLFLTLKITIAVVLLERFHGAADVAELRAVGPVAGLCAVALQSFKLLFRPLAARLYARNDRVALDGIYWRSAIWITLVTFPVLAGCLFLAEPVTVLLFGDRYAAAAPILAILAIGAYVNSAFGLNLYVLQTFARVRLIAMINLVAIALGLGLGFALIPLHGTHGAAWMVTGTVIAYNLMIHLGMAHDTGVTLFPARYVRVFASIAVGIASLAALRLVDAGPTIIAVAIVLVSLVLIRLNRDLLEIADTFPRLARLPLLRHVVARPEAST